MDQNGARFWGISDQSFATSTGTAWSLGSPWSSSKTHCNKQSAYHYNCAHWPQETPDKACLCIQPAAMEKNRSQWLSQSPDPKITHTLPDVLMGENIGRWDWHENFHDGPGHISVFLFQTFFLGECSWNIHLMPCVELISQVITSVTPLSRPLH